MKNKLLIIGALFVLLVVFFFPKTYVRKVEHTTHCGSDVIKKCIGISRAAPSSNECSLTDVCFGWKVKVN